MIKTFSHDLNRRQFTLFLIAAPAVASSGGSWAGERDPEDSGELPGLARTAGGLQFWADEYFFHDWRIQRNVVTGHCRLLDGKNRRAVAGTFQQCLTRMEEIRRQQQLPQMHGIGVVLLHGLGRTRNSMDRMARYLRHEGSFQVFNVGYPTLRGGIADHAQSLAKVIGSLEGMTRIHFVCHSLGNLVVRRWLFDSRDPATGQAGDQRIGRMVMLAPPNQRPQLASRIGASELAARIGGESFRQLAQDWDNLAPTLAVPHFPFGIIAGGRGDERGYNPLVPGDDDMIVSVQSTRLPAAQDFRRLPLRHTFIMDDPRVHRYTLCFLQHGYFESDETRQPIPPEGHE